MRKLSEATKRVRNTHRNRPSPPAVLGTPRLSKPIPAPSDFSPALPEKWQRHMHMLVATGHAGFPDLLAFVEMIRVAHLCDVAYAAAVEEGPTTVGTDGAHKSGAAWRSYLNASSLYGRWLTRFGLDPKARTVVKQLPGPPGELHVVGDDDD